MKHLVDGAGYHIHLPRLGELALGAVAYTLPLLILLVSLVIEYLYPT